MRSVIGGGNRVDTLGEYALTYTDDGDKTWSRQRWFIPVRETNIDTETHPAKLNGETLPDGEEGLKSPEGPIAEDVNLTKFRRNSWTACGRTPTLNKVPRWTRTSRALEFDHG